MRIDPQQDYFALFGLPRRFELDGAALESAFHNLQAEVHPDRHAHLPEAEQRRAMQWATWVNEAFRTLRKPLPRAIYLLELAGVDAGLETNTAMSPAFLMEQMEWREAVEEARAAGEADELEHLRQRLVHHGREMLAGLTEAFDRRGDLDAAAESVRRMMFIEKLQEEIDDALEALES
ncbi:Fe-S protein assembly co-chaperone HscB [Pseudothauera nasutitermitis]|uniref:Co-chaperone protein HscB homolog n=1 Tax=Pseudothauera nasutitermitis TaxID=2565930 RepID=A0A4S4B2A8_9RHOO|nr:Fe-S protein assembly co-chaperone HscB [Pseudothauera nasutitermitis]THF66633.1 Fe-S protein assembly co-chaperone HscB [Pseudothauera nasutitermitis]